MFRPYHWAIIRSWIVIGGDYTVCCMQRDLGGLTINGRSNYYNMKIKILEKKSQVVSGVGIL